MQASTVDIERYAVSRVICQISTSVARQDPWKAPGQSSQLETSLLFGWIRVLLLLTFYHAFAVVVVVGSLSSFWSWLYNSDPLPLWIGTVTVLGCGEMYEPFADE
eukprot:2871751-Amphidinium_carterae.2